MSDLDTPKTLLGWLYAEQSSASAPYNRGEVPITESRGDDDDRLSLRSRYRDINGGIVTKKRGDDDEAGILGLHARTSKRGDDSEPSGVIETRSRGDEDQ